jgi:hypothetical protein
MNDLYLIGNGFDLAHGLKTSYNHFLLWYLNDFLKQLWTNDHFEDDILRIDRTGIRYQVPSDFDSISELLRWLKEHDYTRKSHSFFKKIVDNHAKNKWIDIEYEYYLALVDLYKRLERTGLSSDRNIDKELEGLNNCFDLIKKKLVDYLAGLEISPKIVHKQIEQILRENTGVERQSSLENGYKLFVNFNYTSTIKLYDNDLIYDDKLAVINIHGKLIDEDNPIIFGYGDEMDPHYEKIENLNTKEFLDNMKSFGYFRTDNYQRVIRFINSGKFTVKILGHSCGLSDRILLNTIFEHENCEKIKIYHYEKSPSDNDYIEKTQEISRHFKSSGKGDMRMKIVPFDKNSKMPQNLKDN